VLEAADWATSRGLPVRVLGGGSNLVIADEGVDGLVLKIGLRGVTTRDIPGAVEVTAAAGEPWDDFVRHTVERGWAGLECLSGIPGLVGATPIQNVGAYGQEVSDTLAAVRALDRESGRVIMLAPAECGFGYRDSLFKSRVPGRYVVLAVTYRLIPGGAPYLGYADIARELGSASPSLSAVRETVIRVRRTKSMVLDAGDPNARSCGSFFLNPIVDAATLAAIDGRAAGLTMPRWPQPDGHVKLSAAWLIERAGFTRGQSEGPVGLSTRHTLAIVCHDGARARDVTAFARRVRAGVEERFGVRLHPEPIFWGTLSLD
jgi:UDP-N-acetylmuramate dehydrogenase